jgi:hypothetical protein
MAYTFRNHLKDDVAPLLEHVAQDAGNQIKAASEDMRQKIEAANRDRVTNEDLRQQVKTMTDGLRQEIRTIAGELRQDRELASSPADSIDTRLDQISQDLRRTDQQMARLGESFARQGAQLTAIHGYTKGQGNPTGTSGETGQFMLAMLEAESHADGKGWGIPPRLYALLQSPPPGSADRKHSAGMPDALIPVPYELPDGDPVEALAGIHWPEDVAGCVLVAELTDLAAGGEQGAPIDPAAAERWTSTCPDGRPARLAVGVRRNGEHVCGFRAQDDNGAQIRTDLAVDRIVSALLGTF